MRDAVQRGWMPGGMVALWVVVAVGLLTAPPVPRDRAADLERQLRCPVCQSVSVADSPSATAAAIRREIRQQVAAGRTDAQVLAFFRARYGEWVILDPPPRGSTLLVWVLPAVAVLVGAGTLLALPHGRRPAPPLPEEERQMVWRAAAAWRGRSADEDAP